MSYLSQFFDADNIQGYEELDPQAVVDEILTSREGAYADMSTDDIRNRVTALANSGDTNLMIKALFGMFVGRRNDQKQNRELQIDEVTKLFGRKRMSRDIDVQMCMAINGGFSSETEIPNLYILDLNGFKAVNDTCGHIEGDAVLFEVARRLENAFSDTSEAALSEVYRMGGDEFVIVCGGITEQESVDRIRSAFTDCHREGPNGEQLPIKTCVGSAPFQPQPGCATVEEHVKSIIGQADIAAYADKTRMKRIADEVETSSTDQFQLPFHVLDAH